MSNATHSILVPAPVYASVAKRLARLASQCGVSLETISGTTPLFRKDSDGEITSQVIDCVRLTIGDMPRVNGYSLAGKLSHTEAGNIISLAPSEQGTDLPVNYRSCAPACEHCNTDRRRSETFLVRCPDQTLRQIGRNCLADFLKCDATRLIAFDAFQDAIRSLDDSDAEERLCGGHWGLATLRFLAAAVSSTEAHGFKKTDSESPTRNHAAFLCYPCPGQPEAASDWKACQPTAEHFERAAQIVAWAIASDETGDYAHNLKIALQCSAVTNATQGIVASAPQAYNRAMGVIAEKAARLAAPDAGHIGAPGERVETTVTILRVKAIDSLYGTKLVVSMRTDQGHELVTFTTGRGVNSNQVGQTFTVRGTVKEHSTYQGRSQTSLSRCAFKAVESEAAAIG